MKLLIDMNLSPQWVPVLEASGWKAVHWSFRGCRKGNGRRSRFQNRPARAGRRSACRLELNGGYFIEWDCGADLSADTIEARWQMNNNAIPMATA
ncbi:MAG: hypothetical protein V2B19_21930 [Pseudomonadota bacterium]